MNAYDPDTQTFDEWWTALPDLSEFSSKKAQRDRDALEAELLEMATVTSLLGKRRKTFTRNVYPKIELAVEKWGSVVRRMTGNGLARFSNANASDWLVFVQMETWAVFRGEADRRVSHSLKAVALLSRATMQSVLEQDTPTSPLQVCKEAARAFDAIGWETKYDSGGPDAIFGLPPLTFQFAIDGKGEVRLLENQEDRGGNDPHWTSFPKVVSPTPTIVSIGSGGLIVEKLSFELPLATNAHRDLMGTKWIHENELTSDMRRVLSSWAERLSNKELWVPGYDPDAMASLKLELRL